MEKKHSTTAPKTHLKTLKENRDSNRVTVFPPAMRLPAILKKKRQYKSEDVIIANINDSTGLRSPKGSPRRTPKKRKNKATYRAQNLPSCKRVLDISSVSPYKYFPDQSSPSLPVDHVSRRADTDTRTSLLSCDTDKNNIISNLKDISAKNQSSGRDVLGTIIEEQPVLTEQESVKEIEIIKIVDPLHDKKADDIDEGYFDLSYVESEKADPEKRDLESSFSKDLKDCAVHSSPYNSDGEKQAVKVTADACTTTVPAATDSLVDILNTNFQTKLQIGVSIQTECEPKRRKVSKACQITDEAVNTLNKKLLNLRNKMNKRLVENEDALDKNAGLKKRCSELDTERLSLLAQTEALQNECVRKMYDNDQLNLKVDQKECHISTLKETLLLRDKEIHLLHRQPSAAGLSQKLTDYRELEVLRIDNIRLLHDNRALTASLDSLNGQLCSLRRIGRSYDECSDNVILMNKRLAEDNSNLTCNLNTVKRELRSVTQEKEETVEELHYLRSSCKRSAAERDALEKQKAGDTLAQDNKELVKQNTELKQAVSLLQEEVHLLHSELSNTRNTHLAFDRTLEEKSTLQNHVAEVEGKNGELWSRVAALRQRSDEQTEEQDQQKHENNILSSENEELRKTNDTLFTKTESLKSSLSEEIEKNAAMAQKIQELTSGLSDATLSIEELRSTMEFLQVEHSFIQNDVEKKNDSISEMAEQIAQLKISKQELVVKCKGKLKEKTKKLNASRIKLGYALLEMRELNWGPLNSHGSSSSVSSE